MKKVFFLFLLCILFLVACSNNTDVSQVDLEHHKSYWRLFFWLLIGDIVITIIYSFLVTAIMLFTMGIVKAIEFLKLGNLTSIIILIPKVIISIGSQVYLWIVWSAFCSYNVLYYLDNPEVTHKWLYYLTGFLSAGGPMAYLSSQEQETTSSFAEKQKINNHSFIYILLTSVAYVVFCYSPSLMNYKFISFFNDWFSSL